MITFVHSVVGDHVRTHGAVVGDHVCAHGVVVRGADEPADVSRRLSPQHAAQLAGGVGEVAGGGGAL